MAKRFKNSADLVKIGGKYGKRTVIKAVKDPERGDRSHFILKCECGKYSITEGYKIVTLSGLNCQHQTRNTLTNDQLAQHGIDPLNQLSFSTFPVEKIEPIDCKWLCEDADIFDMEIHINTLRKAIKDKESSNFCRDKEAFLERLKSVDSFIHMSFSIAIWQHGSGDVTAKFNSNNAVQFLHRVEHLWSRTAIEVFGVVICLAFDEMGSNE